MCDRVVFYYCVQFSFHCVKCPNTELFLVCIYLSRSVCLSKYVLCLRHLKITNVFSLYKFHNCRIMQLRHFKKLEMCQATRTILMLKVHIPIILFIIPRKASHSFRNVTNGSSKTIIELLYDWNFKKACPSAPKIPENLKNILGAGG